MTSTPIQKLNKKMIYRLLVVVSPIVVVALVFGGSDTKKKRRGDLEESEARIDDDSALLDAGMNLFPKNYDDLIIANDHIEEGFDGNEQYYDARGHTKQEFGHDGEYLPEEAEKYAEAQRANGHHQSQRYATPAIANMGRAVASQVGGNLASVRESDIMFIDNSKANSQNVVKASSDDRMFDILEKTMGMAGAAGASIPDAVFGGAGLPNGNSVDALQDKINYLSGGSNHSGTLSTAKKYSLSQGSIIPAILNSEINTDLPGPILASVSQNIWDSRTGRSLLIPQGSKLIGQYNARVSHGQVRAQIVWTRIIFPNQVSIDLGKMLGVDARGTSGAQGQVNNHYDQVALGLVMSTSIGVATRLVQGKYDANNASMGQEMGQAFAQSAGNLGNKIAERMLNRPPTIKIAMGEKINVFVGQDLRLRPYQG